MGNFEQRRERGARRVAAVGLAAALSLGGIALPFQAAQAVESDEAGQVAAMAADDSVKHSITVVDATDGTYSLYKLMDAGAEKDGEFQEAFFRPEFVDAIATAYNQATGRTMDASSDVAIANALHSLGADDSAAVRAFAHNLAKAVSENGALNGLMDAQSQPGDPDRTGAANQTVRFDGVGRGYYLLIQQDAPQEGASRDKTAMTSALLVPVYDADVTVDPRFALDSLEAKVTPPVIDKQVRDTAGSEAWDGQFGHIADAGLRDGAIDALEYRITGTVSSNILEFKKGAEGYAGGLGYRYTLRDRMPAGLDVTAGELNGGTNAWRVSITANGVDITSAFAVSVEKSDDIAVQGDTVVWNCDDLIPALNGAGIADADLKDASIEVLYRPVYDEGDVARMYAAAGSFDSPDVNSISLTFSNNPYVDSYGSTTPEKQTRVYDYNLDIVKKDGAAAELPGAEFTLTDERGEVVDTSHMGVEVSSGQPDGQASRFSFHGLEADVVYTLTETVTPEGTRTIEPIKFKIEAVADEGAEHVVAIRAVEVNPDALSFITGSSISVSESSPSTVLATVVDIPAHEYPFTGGGGIAAGVVCALILIGGGIVAIIRRAKTQDETKR